MNASDTAAWWGALTGTAALVWEIVRYFRSGPRLRISASPDMQFVIPGQGLNNESHVVVNVRNVGDQATTITHFAGACYPTFLDRIRRRNARQFVITTGIDVTVPHKIGPGETWSGYAVQTELEKVGAQGGLLYMGVQHSMAEKPQFTRVRFKKPAG